EVIGLAVAIVAVYLFLNLIVVGSGLFYLATHPEQLNGWYENVAAGKWELHGHSGTAHSWWMILGLSALYFPKLALGLSGFETGVAVMPLIEGDPTDTHDNPRGRIRNTRKLLATAAVIMSIFLLGSSLVTATLIHPDQLKEATGGQAADRALAYLAHGE